MVSHIENHRYPAYLLIHSAKRNATLSQHKNSSLQDVNGGGNLKISDKRM